MGSANRIQDHVHAVMDPDGAVLLDVKRGKYFSLNGVASDIWGAMQEGLSAPEIETLLQRTYGVPAERARGDVAAFMARLEREQLVHAGS
jgi:hypothetical protein